MGRTYLELLAPARNIDIGIAAIDCGADAVYIAGPAFGARKAAGNSIEDIRALCSYAHLFGVKIFITLNTIIYENELDDAYKLMQEVKNAGADAIIVQDPAILMLAEGDGSLSSKIDLPLHASTQCSIRDSETAAYYESLGFSRLVLEREISIENIRSIREKTGCELEFFVHGALCVCYSGHCYLSEYLVGRSANRGECAQACRSRYDLLDESGKVLLRDKAILSLKDYNLKNRLESLAEAGINSFKIEGRLKNISYVKNVVRDYSLALDELCRRRPEKYARASFGKVSKGFIPDPEKTFNRGYTELFIDGKRGSWAAMDTPKSIGEAVGIISSVRKSGNNNMEISLSPFKKGLELSNGDGFSFATDKEVIGFRGDVCKGQIIKSRAIKEIKAGSILYRNLSVDFEKRLEALPCIRLINADVSIEVELSEDSKYRLICSALTEDGRRIIVQRDAGTEKADDKERMQGLFANQINKKSGVFNFRLVSMCVKTSDGSVPYMSSAGINDIRRSLGAELEKLTCIQIPLMKGTKKELNAKDKDFSYKWNISNSLSEAVHKSRGAQTVEKAYELSRRPGAELMRTKYCVRYEIGLCPKYHRAKNNSPLYILNNGKRLKLNFDCKLCEMTVTETE